MTARACILVLIALAGGAACAPGADAYVLAGRPWVDTTVTYRAEGAGARAAARYAARSWNAADVGARFRATTSGRADVVVRTGGAACTGEATVGHVRVGFVRIGRCSAGLRALMTTHEFGHVLGLGHERRRCALMNVALAYPSGTPVRCAERPLAAWLASPLQADDLRGARALSRSR